MDIKKLSRIVDDYEATTINSKEGGRTLYEVGLWPGAGYTLDLYRVYADAEDEALERIVAYCESKGYVGYFTDEYYDSLRDKGVSEEEIDKDMEDAGDIYIDATMEGAATPHILRGENLMLREVK